MSIAKNKVLVSSKHNFFICVLALSLLLSLTVVLPIQAAYSPSARKNVLLSSSTAITLAPGVTLTRYNEYVTSGFMQFSVLEIDLDNSAIEVSPYISKGGLTSSSTLSTIAKSNGLIAAVNADFFDISNTNAPMSTLVKDGELIRSTRVNDNDFTSLVIFNDASAMLQQLSWSGTAVGPRGIVLSILGYNENNLVSNASTIFDLNWPLGSHRASYSSWLQSDLTTIVVVDKNGYVMSVQKGPITQSSLIQPGNSVGMTIGDENNRPIPYVAYPYYEIVARGVDAEAAAKLYVGEKLDISLAITNDIDDIFTAFSGKPVLINNGTKNAVLQTNYSSISGNSRAQRTAIGISRDGKRLYYVVVDGRTSGSLGMTLYELADLMADLGAYNALNLDGGGSSSIVYNEPSTDRYLLGSRLASSERGLPYAVGISYSDDYIKNAVPVHVSIEAEYVKQGFPSIPIKLDSHFESAVLGGIKAFSIPEVMLAHGYIIHMKLTAKDALGNIVDLYNQDEYTIEWSVTGSSSTLSFLDSHDISFKPNDAGKYDVSVVIRDKSSGAESYASSTMNIRALSSTAFIGMEEIDRSIVGTEYLTLDISVYDSYGFLIPDKQRSLSTSVVMSDGSIITLDNAILPCNIFKPSDVARLIISSDNVTLICSIAVESSMLINNSYPSRIKIVPESIITKEGKAIPAQRSISETVAYSRDSILTLNVARGGLTATDSTQWSRLENFLKNSDARDVTIILTGGYVIDQFGNLTGFTSTDEATLFLDLLTRYSSGDNKRISLVQRETGYTGWMMYNGIKFIWEK